MKLFADCVAAIAVASIGACAPAGETANVSFAGNWAGTVTCYKMQSPLTITIAATAPKEAEVSMGDGGVLTWAASVEFDNATRAVTIKSNVPTGDAAVLAGALAADANSISGHMDKQLCTDFKLTRQS
jgi:hypothetical protein